jgi:hypothetical protein
MRNNPIKKKNNIMPIYGGELRKAGMIKVIFLSQR